MEIQNTNANYNSNIESFTRNSNYKNDIYIYNSLHFVHNIKETEYLLRIRFVSIIICIFCFGKFLLNDERGFQADLIAGIFVLLCSHMSVNNPHVGHSIILMFLFNFILTFTFFLTLLQNKVFSIETNHKVYYNSNYSFILYSINCLNIILYCSGIYFATNFCKSSNNAYGDLDYCYDREFTKHQEHFDLINEIPLTQKQYNGLIESKEDQYSLRENIFKKHLLEK